MPRIAAVDLRMMLATRCMKLDNRVAMLRQHLRAGTVDQKLLGEIEASAYKELSEQCFGVSQQFFQVHQLADDSIVEVYFNGKIGETWIRIYDERYYWVVQSKIDEAGVWKAYWGYCSHRARVELTIHRDQMTAQLITETLGIDPDKIAIKGQTMNARPNSRKFESHRRTLDSQTPEFWAFERRREGLLTGLAPFTPVMKDLSEQAVCKRCVNLALYGSIGWACG